VGKREVVVSHDPEQTYQIGQRLGQRARPGQLILLRGPLGAGKSVLARGFAAGMGVSDWRGSPTFTLINEYDAQPSLYHIDLYRLEREDIEALGLEEYVRPDSVVLVEWADRAPAYLADLAWGGIIWVEITIVGQEEREVSLEMRQLDPAGHSPHGWEDA
jgi:tRNA threonylcarbamoyladenosine biosynthesis protein TsaE